MIFFGSLGLTEEQPPLQLDAATATTQPRERLLWEKELLGLYISQHPLDDYDNYLASKTQPLTSFSQRDDNKPARVGGIVTAVRKITTKQGAAMAFVRLENKEGEIELIVFPRAYEQTPELWQPDNVIEVRGKVNARNRNGRPSDEIKIMVDRARVIDLEQARKIKAAPAKPTAFDGHNLQIKLDALPEAGRLVALKHLLERTPGASAVQLLVGHDQVKVLKLPFTVAITDTLIAQLEELLGEGHVRTEAAASVHPAGADQSSSELSS